MHISAALESDIPQLCTLLHHLFEQEADFIPDAAVQARGLALIIRHPEVGRILVAHRNDQVVGMVNLLFTVSTALGGRVALLEDMVVSPAARDSGVGSALLRQAIETTRQEGCLRITLLTDQDNDAAQRFYLRHGFAASSMLPMRLHLV